VIETFSVFLAPEMEDEKIDLVLAGLIRAGLVLARSEDPKLEIEAYTARWEQFGAPRSCVGAGLPFAVRIARAEN
jgi:hypothetical protein